MDNSSRNHTLQQCLMYTRAHTTIYATQFFYFKSRKPLAVRQFVARCLACTCPLALLTKFTDISGLKYALAPCLAGCEICAKYYRYIHLPFDTKLSACHAGCQLQSDEIPDSKNTHQHPAAIQVRALDTGLQAWLKIWKRFYSDGKCPLHDT